MTRLKNWLPAIAMMALIFAASSIPGDEMPRFDEFDFTVKKLGHSVGYALLAASYLRGLKTFNPEGREVHKGNSSLGRLTIFAWLLALIFAVTDEFHQSFTPGRHPSMWDVAVFDNVGALIGVWTYSTFIKHKQKGDASAPPRANS